MPRYSTLFALALPFVFAGCSILAPAEHPFDLRSLSRESGFIWQQDAESQVANVEIPRPDLEVTIGNSRLAPGQLSAWASVTGTSEKAVLLAEAIVTESEVEGLLEDALHAGMSVTALHNSLLWERPRLLSIHLSERGSQAELAKSFAKVFDRVRSGSLRKASAFDAGQISPKAEFDPEPIHRFLWKGERVGGVYRIDTGKGTEIDGQPIGRRMGAHSWASFSGKSERAFVNGDIGMLETEMNKVLLALLEERFSVVSIHSHFTRETPRLMFVHFVGAGPLEGLAASLKHVLHQEKSFRGSQ